MSTVAAGGTIAKLTEIASAGKVYGIDYSEDSVAPAADNQRALDRHRPRGDSARLPFQACRLSNTFDLVTAIETHFVLARLADDLRKSSAF